MGIPHLCLIGARAAFLLAFVQWVNGHHYAKSPTKQLKIVHEWTFFDFDFPHEKDREHAIHKGEYVPTNVSAFECNRYKDKTFITTPRIKYGNPSTLNIISHKKAHDGSPLLKPFPDWESNRLGNCHGLTSVYTTHIDDQGRLWVLDSGVVDIFGKVPDKICPPKIQVIDLNEGNKVVATFVFPSKVIDCNSLFVKLAVDQRGPHLSDFWVYISDAYAGHLVVLNVHHKTFTRVTHPTFLKDPDHVDFIIDGVAAFWPLGIHSVILGPLCDDDRTVYYHALAGVKECYVQASTLQNPAFAKNELAFPDSFSCFKKTRESLSPIENAYGDVIFYFIEELNSVKCWNTTLDPYMENTAIVARNETTLQTVEALKVVGNELYGISSRLQLFFYNALSPKEINYRLLKANVNYLLNGTPCRECAHNKYESHHESHYDDHHHTYESEYENKRDPHESHYDDDDHPYESEYESKRDPHESQYESRHDSYESGYKDGRDHYKSEYKGGRDDHESGYESSRDSYGSEYEGSEDHHESGYRGSRDHHESGYESRHDKYKPGYEGSRDHYESENGGSQEQKASEYESQHDNYKSGYEGSRDQYESKYGDSPGHYDSEYESGHNSHKTGYGGSQNPHESGYDGTKDPYRSEYGGSRDHDDSKYDSRHDSHESGYGGSRDHQDSKYAGGRDDYKARDSGSQDSHKPGYEGSRDHHESGYGGGPHDYEEPDEHERDEEDGFDYKK